MKFMRIIPFVLMAAFIFPLVTFSGEEPEKEEIPSEMVDGNNKFAINLYRQLTENKDESVFFSPFSVSSALAMTYAGAKGETAAEMKDTLCFELEGEKLHKAMAAVTESLNNRKYMEYVRKEKDGESRVVKEEKKAFDLVVANSLWGQKDYPFKKDFVELNGKYYDAGLNLVDYLNKTEEARQAINKWIEEKTNEKIKDIIPQGALDQTTRLVLANAIYFKAAWADDFYKGNTKNRDFYLADGEKIQVPTMKQTEQFKYFIEDGLRVVSLPYKRDAASMVVFVPSSPEEFKKFENGLSVESLKAAMGKLKRGKIILEMPKFKMDYDCALSEVMKKMGMVKAFDMEKADFTGVADVPGDPLFISTILHKAYIDLNEKGTEAAAATVVALAGAGAPRPEEPDLFKVDRPFVYLIRDNETGSILFMGRVMKPEGYKE